MKPLNYLTLHKHTRLLLLVGLLSGCSSTPPLEAPITIVNGYTIQHLPETIELPAGQFYMGDQSGAGDSDERPVQQMVIAAFALGRYEITFQQFDEYTDAEGLPRVLSSNTQRGVLPVVNVSWHAAQAYTQWLSVHTGQKWRLASEAEWEYAARAGQYSHFQSGNAPESVCSVGNIADQTALKAGIATEITSCNDHSATSKAGGAYAANSLGLHDMHGNVWEWVADCHVIYGQAIDDSLCTQRVVRGGSFLTPASSARLSNREALNPTQFLNQVGFRVVREL
ncbi:MAG: SUMF1/EgtB/PvdO family nonheme iron enzyme [Methyloprofundus sp.]|nr:SUMF1/EgtB/PvdO family nonheme iron enzyme [Methyloprofundus sp.]